MGNQIGPSKLHAACDVYWQALIHKLDLGGWTGLSQWVVLSHLWTQDKHWIDAGCPLIGNFNGDGKYPSPPEWWPALTESQPPR